MAFHAPIPILRMFDEAKARELYIDWLGDCRLHLGEHHGDGTPGTAIRIRVDELEAYHQDLLAKRYKYGRPGLHDQEWGTREMVVGGELAP
jgi:hypothetical protein